MYTLLHSYRHTHYTLYVFYTLNILAHSYGVMPTNASICPASGPSARGPGLAGHVHAYTFITYARVSQGMAAGDSCNALDRAGPDPSQIRVRSESDPSQIRVRSESDPSQIRVRSESDPYLSSRAGDGSKRLLPLQAAPRSKMAHSVSAALTRAPQSRPVSHGPSVTACRVLSHGLSCRKPQRSQTGPARRRRTRPRSPGPAPGHGTLAAAGRAALTRTQPRV